MLDTTTKRRIDTARDILVGKIPDPKSQVEQITIALIYKFMDDMDAEAEELGGERKFFGDGFSQYGWARLLRSGLGGHEILNLYAEAITRMAENPGIPLLFRNIFKNAYLPYRDPETLRSFLKIIDEFSYDHSERLGDAYEYLLSVLGSQGDAGQFRTPRHIIDFIVSIVNPKKGEIILDPACGTAGFLISSYKHLKSSNIDEQGNLTLTPDEKSQLIKNFKGYDISPDMVRLSLVNMYLHGFSDPHIHEYDTLTSQDRWNEYADVILANPPFMSPKGGIKPHNRFSVQSKRSEVLFVDYIADHLTPEGRAGIIVPEGIIFQSQNAYKQLRKKLVDESLVAVISMPAGVFQPYSGVKTSILILDKGLAKKSDTIGFFKVENDGYGLGAQRRPIEKNDLPQLLEEVKGYFEYIREGDGQEEYLTNKGLVVKREKIAENGEHSLSGERYREIVVRDINWPLVALGDIVEIQSGSRQKGGAVESGIPSIGGEQIDDKGNIRFDKMRFISEDHFKNMKKGALQKGDVLVVKDGATTGKTGYFSKDIQAAVNEHVFIFRAKDKVIPYYLYQVIRTDTFQNRLKPFIKGIIGGISLEIKNITLPLPPLEIQKEIVEEIKAYQIIIEGARAIIDNYRPHIPIDPDWPIKNLDDISLKITDGTHRTPTYIDKGVPFLRVTDITQSNKQKKYISKEEHQELVARCQPQKGDILYSKNGTIGVAKLVKWDWDFSIFVSLALIKPKVDLVNPHYLECYLNSDLAFKQATARSKSGTVTNLHLVDIKTMQIPLPPLKEQRALVAEIEAEQALVHANRELIERFEKKIEATINRVWGEEG